MRALLGVLAAIGFLAAGGSYAASGADVIKSKCAGCHDAEKKKVGPSIKDIAAKHKADKGAVAKMVEKLKEGKGHMKVAASEAELKAAVEQMLK